MRLTCFCRNSFLEKEACMNTIRERIKNIERFMLEHAEELELDEEELEED